MEEFRLSADGFRHFPQSEPVTEFHFVLGNKTYECAWFVADFVSPRIARLHAVDPSIDQYFVETIDSHNQFQSFLELGRGCPLFVTDENRSFLLAIARELENFELYSAISTHFERKLTVSEAVARVTDPSFVCPYSISLLASVFFELDSPTLNQLAVSALFEILSSDSLRLISEDLLYDFIIGKRPDYFCLLRFVRFEFLSTDRIVHFASIGFGLSGEFDPALWKTLSDRLIVSLRRVDWPLNRSSPLDGIFSYLRKKAGDDIFKNGIVSLTSKAEEVETEVKRQSLFSNSFFLSNDVPRQWVKWDFRSMRVQPSHYSIRGSSYNNLKSWVLEGSLDNVTWVELDRQSNNFELYGN
jgi:hypothetical protein